MSEPPLTRLERALIVLIIAGAVAMFWFALHTHQGILH